MLVPSSFGCRVMFSVVSVSHGDKVLGWLKKMLGKWGQSWRKAPTVLSACQAAVLLECQPSGLWRCSSQWGYLVGMLHFGMVGDFMGLWGPLQVGGTALQPMFSQCCPSEVQAPVTSTELSWVVTLLWEQEIQESFPAL